MNDAVAKDQEVAELEAIETREWLESLNYVLQYSGPDRVRTLLQQLQDYAYGAGVHLPFSANTPYINTIPVEAQPHFPGDREFERRIKSIIRWNAMAMVVRANRSDSSIGGHISTYASAATLYEIGFNHFFQQVIRDVGGNMVIFSFGASENSSKPMISSFSSKSFIFETEQL